MAIIWCSYVSLAVQSPRPSVKLTATWSPTTTYAMIRFAKFVRSSILAFPSKTLLMSPLVTLSRSHYLRKSKSDPSLHITHPYRDDHYEQQTDSSPLGPLELYHAGSRYSWTHRHPAIRSGFEATASLSHPGETSVPPLPLVESVTEPPQPELPKGSKLFILVTCTCVAVFLQALVSVALYNSELSNRSQVPKKIVRARS